MAETCLITTYTGVYVEKKTYGAMRSRRFQIPSLLFFSRIITMSTIDGHRTTTPAPSPRRKDITRWPCSKAKVRPPCRIAVSDERNDS